MQTGFQLHLKLCELVLMLLNLNFELVYVRCDLLAHTVDLFPDKVTRRKESIEMFVLRVDLLIQILSDPVLQISNFSSN